MWFFCNIYNHFFSFFPLKIKSTKCKPPTPPFMSISRLLRHSSLRQSYFEKKTTWASYFSILSSIILWSLVTRRNFFSATISFSHSHSHFLTLTVLTCTFFRSHSLFVLPLTGTFFHSHSLFLGHIYFCLLTLTISKSQSPFLILVNLYSWAQNYR